MKTAETEWEPEGWSVVFLVSLLWVILTTLTWSFLFDGPGEGVESKKEFWKYVSFGLFWPVAWAWGIWLLIVWLMGWAAAKSKEVWVRTWEHYRELP